MFISISSMDRTRQAVVTKHEIKPEIDDLTVRKATE